MLFRSSSSVRCFGAKEANREEEAERLLSLLVLFNDVDVDFLLLVAFGFNFFVATGGGGPVNVVFSGPVDNGLFVGGRRVLLCLILVVVVAVALLALSLLVVRVEDDNDGHAAAGGSEADVVAVAAVVDGIEDESCVFTGTSVVRPERASGGGGGCCCGVDGFCRIFFRARC